VVLDTFQKSSKTVVCVCVCVCVCVLQLQQFYGSLDFVWDYPGEPVLER